MILDIVKYGNPALRKKGARIERITPDIKKLVADMLETMKDAKGVGLAAQQIGHALQLTVLDVRGVTDRPSTLHIDGKEVIVDEQMPMALINPELKLTGDKMPGPEGCLSFPEIYSEIVRPLITEVRAINEHGAVVQFLCGGLLSRAIQHEMDHLNGILFIDRMTRRNKEELQDELEDLEESTRVGLNTALRSRETSATSKGNSGIAAIKLRGMNEKMLGNNRA